jgi:hypothetical protein
MWVVGHFHFVMAAATLLGTFAAIYYWFPKIFGRRTSPLLGRIHFWGTLVGALVTFGGMLAAGWAGQPRRAFDPSQYGFLDGIEIINKISTHGAFVLAGFQLVFVVNLLWSLRRGPRAGADPWGAAPTLEWTTTSPPPPDNFARLPVVAGGAHEPGLPGQRGDGAAAGDRSLQDSEIGALVGTGSLAVIGAGLLFGWGALPDASGWASAGERLGPAHLAAPALLVIATLIAGRARWPAALLSAGAGGAGAWSAWRLFATGDLGGGLGLAAVGFTVAAAAALLAAAAGAASASRRTARILAGAATGLAGLVSILVAAS